MSSRYPLTSLHALEPNRRSCPTAAATIVLTHMKEHPSEIHSASQQSGNGLMKHDFLLQAGCPLPDIGQNNSHVL